jgi:hypothetical protein
MNESTGRHALPLSDYHELPLPELPQRIHRLSGDEIDRLLAYERLHGGRANVLAVLASRRNQLAQGRQPAPSDPAQPRQ